MNVCNDDKRIAGEGNSYNLENYEQEIEDGKLSQKKMYRGEFCRAPCFLYIITPKAL